MTTGHGWNPDQWAALLGNLVMSAADLEYQTAGLVQFVLGEADEKVARDHWGAPTRVLADSLAKAAAVRPEILPLVEPFRTLMDYRHALVHGLWSGPDDAGDMTVFRPRRFTRAEPVDLNAQVTLISLDDLDGVRDDIYWLGVEVEFTWASLKDPKSVSRNPTSRVWRTPTWLNPDERRPHAATDEAGGQSKD